MTVQSLLGNMSQKELVNWIAFHKIEREEYEAQQAQRGRPQQQKSEAGPSQSTRDSLLFHQLLAMAQSSKDEQHK